MVWAQEELQNFFPLTCRVTVIIINAENQTEEVIRPRHPPWVVVEWMGESKSKIFWNLLRLSDETICSLAENPYHWELTTKSRDFPLALELDFALLLWPENLICNKIQVYNSTNSISASHMCENLSRRRREKLFFLKVSPSARPPHSTHCEKWTSARIPKDQKSRNSPPTPNQLELFTSLFSFV